MRARTNRIELSSCAVTICLFCIFSHPAQCVAGTISGAASHIYWTTEQEIYRSDLDGGNVVRILDTDTNIGNVAVDRRNDHLYWYNGRRVQRSSLDGSRVTTLVEIPGFGYWGDVAVDPRQDIMFFAEGRNNVIYSAEMDGSNLQVVAPASGRPQNDAGIKDLWLDRLGKKLYWANNSRFFRSNYDGTEVESLFDSGVRVDDFDIDLARGRIYWASPSTTRNGGRTYVARLDGSNQIAVGGALWFSSGIAVDVDRQEVYYTDTWGSGPTNYPGTVRVRPVIGNTFRSIVNLGFNVSPREVTTDVLLVPEPAGWVIMGTLIFQYLIRRDRNLPLSILDR